MLQHSFKQEGKAPLAFEELEELGTEKTTQHHLPITCNKHLNIKRFVAAP